MRMALEDEFDCVTAGDAEAAVQKMEEHWVQVVVSDQRMPGRSGVALLTDLRERWPEAVRIMVTGFTDPNDMARAINDAGIHQFLTKPWHPEQLLVSVRNGARLASLARENERMALEMRLLASTTQNRLEMRRAALIEKMGFESILRTAQSPMNAVIHAARRYASFDIPVMITGEPGTGRSRLARAIHLASLRSDRPFLSLNLAGLNEETAAIELFGLKRGNQPGAAYRLGLVKKADRGTLLIEGIEHASPTLQLSLQRLAEEGSFSPVGGQETQVANLRLITTADTGLARRIAEGAFRKDLYYALSGGEIAIPPLRQRRCDISIIAQTILRDLIARHGKPAEGFTPAAIDFLENWDWPGNLSELANEVARMLIFAQEPVLGAELINRQILQAVPSGMAASIPVEGVLTASGTLRERVDLIEMRILRETLTRHRWNKSRAAAELGLSRVGLRAKIDRFGIANPAGTDPEEEED